VRIAELCIRRPVLATMLMGSLCALGLISLPRLGVDLFPRFDFPFISVTATLEGATPETIETEVTDVLEESINTIGGIETLRSVSSEGVARVFVQFELEEDIEVKAQDVRDKVARARADLPLDLDPPIIEKVDPASAPILALVLSGPLPIRELTRLADDVVKERVQRVPGVGQVTLVGAREREVRIWLDADRLRSYALTVDDVIQALRREHAEVPGGRLESQGGRSEFSLKTRGEVERVREFEDVTVAFRDGAPTRISDLARVEDGMADERSYAELDGVQGVALEVRRQSGRNLVETAQAVRAAVAELEAELPEGVALAVTRDLSRFISAQARDVALDIALGALLAVLVTLAFLRSARSTLIVATAIPVSVISSFFLFFALDFSLNLVTLMALSVAIGLLIDDAIVVLEAIHREIEAGATPFEAAATGTRKIGLAVFAATASVLAVFVPIAFMSGMIGRMFYQYGLAIAFSVAVSLLVAVTLTPMLCARVLRAEERHGPVFAWLEAKYLALERAYARALASSLRHRLLVVGIAAVAVYAGIAAARGVPMEFSSKTDRSEFEGAVELPLGVGIAEAKQAAQAIGRALRETPGVVRSFVTAGGGARGRINEIALYAQTTPKQQRDESQFEIMARAREAIARAVPQARNSAVSEVPWISGDGTSTFNVEYNLSGPDLRVLADVSERWAARMREDPHFVDARSSFQRGRPELQVRIDRSRAADLGVPVRALAATVRALVGGVDAATFQDNGKRYDVRVRLDEPQRDEISDLGQIQVRSESGALVDLANVATLRVETGAAEIERRNRARRVALLANTPQKLALGTAIARLEQIAAADPPPPGYRGEWEGSAQRMRDSLQDVLMGFALALLSLYIVLASQFESFSQPLVIMVSAPLSFVGAFLALRVTGTPMSIFAQIGLVALMGLVMKNGILLVDHANQLRAQGLSAADAIRRAGPVRLRPVLMTQLATIAGMLPVALANSDGAEFRVPMGVLVIGGLMSSTFLTLLVVPALYSASEEWRERVTHLAARARGGVAVGHGAAGADPAPR
jgi:HAE1 family hydrophobic/amphiphilic exporter-1